MAQNVVINGVQYSNVPEVDIPKVGGGTAKFYDSASVNVTAADLRNGKTAIGASGEVTGSMTEKTAATYTPTTSDQTIAANQYLAGAQTIKGDANLVASNIKSGVQIFNITGTLALPSISQDSVTKVLSIA